MPRGGGPLQQQRRSQSGVPEHYRSFVAKLGRQPLAPWPVAGLLPNCRALYASLRALPDTPEMGSEAVPIDLSGADTLQQAAVAWVRTDPSHPPGASAQLGDSAALVLRSGLDSAQAPLCDPPPAGSCGVVLGLTGHPRTLRSTNQQNPLDSTSVELRDGDVIFLHAAVVQQRTFNFPQGTADQPAVVMAAAVLPPAGWMPAAAPPPPPRSPPPQATAAATPAHTLRSSSLPQQRGTTPVSDQRGGVHPSRAAAAAHPVVRPISADQVVWSDKDFPLDRNLEGEGRPRRHAQLRDLDKWKPDAGPRGGGDRGRAGRVRRPPPQPLSPEEERVVSALEQGGELTEAEVQDAEHFARSSEPSALRRMCRALHMRRDCPESLSAALAVRAVTELRSWQGVELEEVRPIAFWFTAEEVAHPYPHAVRNDWFAPEGIRRAICAELRDQCGHIHPVALTYAAWSLSAPRSPGRPEEELLQAIAASMQGRRVGELDMASLGMLPLAVANVVQSPNTPRRPQEWGVQLLHAVAAEIAEPGNKSYLAPRNMQNICEAYARASERSGIAGRMLKMVTEHAADWLQAAPASEPYVENPWDKRLRVPNWSTYGLAQTLEALASNNFTAPTLFRNAAIWITADLQRMHSADQLVGGARAVALLCAAYAEYTGRLRQELFAALADLWGEGMRATESQIARIHTECSKIGPDALPLLKKIPPAPGDLFIARPSSGDGEAEKSLDLQWTDRDNAGDRRSSSRGNRWAVGRGRGADPGGSFAPLGRGRGRGGGLPVGTAPPQPIAHDF